MSSESRSQFGDASLAGFLALAVCATLTASGCVHVDVYDGPHKANLDAGTTRVDSGTGAESDASSVEACRECAARECAADYGACAGDPDCEACFTDPNGARCRQSVNRHAFRNCACASSTCAAACPSLCPTPASTGTDAPARIAQDCISCTGTYCGTEVGACVVEPVCLACVTDARNPKCTTSSAWTATTDCLCGRPGTCFEECCAVAP
jgi:hypothetical protein